MLARRVLSLMVLSLLCTHTALSAQMTGRAIMQKNKELHKSPYEFIKQKMTLIDKKDRKEVRNVRYYIKEYEDGMNKTMFVFMEPRDIRGTALLTWQHKDRDDDQWLYLPARRKMQRIAKGGRKSYFMGTDFTYEDLQPELLDDYTYTLVKEEVYQENPCYVIEAVPADEQKKRRSGYRKRLLWVTKEQYTILKIEFYDRREKLIKTQTNSVWQHIQDSLWRPQKLVMVHHKHKHTTLLELIARDLATAIDDRVFTERFILKGQHIQ